LPNLLKEKSFQFIEKPDSVLDTDNNGRKAQNEASEKIIVRKQHKNLRPF
jgi:hypothetical protein